MRLPDIVDKALRQAQAAPRYTITLPRCGAHPTPRFNRPSYPAKRADWS
jgi:hypothetical protein